MTKHIFTTIVLFFFFSNLLGQITTEEDPISFGKSIPTLTINETTYKVLSSIDLESLAQEDEEDKANGVPPRFGFPHEVNYNLENSGEWIVLSNGDKIWRLSISCPDALSINLLYDKFWLPDGAKFFIYSSDYQHQIGAMTSENNKGERNDIQGFATGLVYGDRVILEYFVPREVRDIGVISIAYVVHGYRYIVLPNDTRDYGGSGTCQVNVNCPEGDAWHLEKNAIALILANGYRICTGSLVNTTTNDHQPYLLTANHCLCKKYDYYGNCIEWYDAITEPNLNHWSFYWHYESKWCSNSKPSTFSTSGATIVANSDNSDFALLKLTEDPLNKKNVTPYYLGWDATGNPGKGGVCIHHPSGDIKKIATHNITPLYSSNCMDFESNYGGYYFNSNFWRINWIATTNGHSVTEGGSSGSPLLNSSYHVIGQLFGAGLCANPNCDDPPEDIANYGKFSVSWNYFSTIQRQLKHWLDPNNTGILTHHGTFDCSGTYTINNQTYGSNTNILEDKYCVIVINNTTYNSGSVAKYYVQDRITINPGTLIDAGSKVMFVAKGVPPSRDDENFSPPNPNEPEEFIADEEMLSSLQLAINENEINEVDFTIFPNPNDGNFTIRISGYKESYTLQIFNAMGLNIGEINCNEETVHISKSELSAGLYYVKMTSNDKIIVKKVIVQ